MKSAVAVAALLLLAACPSRSQEDYSQNTPPRGATSTTPNRTPAPASAVANQTVDVQLTESAIKVPESLNHGSYVFHISNAGKEDHGFAIDGNATHTALAEPLKRGDTADLPVELKPGKYTVKDRGMSAIIDVK